MPENALLGQGQFGKVFPHTPLLNRYNTTVCMAHNALNHNCAHGNRVRGARALTRSLQVKAAVHTETGQRVAVKEIKKSSIKTKKDVETVKKEVRQPSAGGSAFVP